MAADVAHTRMKPKPHTFQKQLSQRLTEEVQEKRQEKLAKIKLVLNRTTNLILLLLTSLLIGFIWQQRVATPYILSEQAVGGDYFNALTYAKFYAQNIPFPPTGWMPFWNAGVPVIGGYPFGFFYLMLPLTRFFDIASSMELTSIILILFFFIASHFLFWEVGRNHLLALLFTGILIITPASYYALTAEGLITASAMQWFLPATLFFIVRFIKFQQRFLLVVAGTLTGLALLTHSPMAFVTVLTPAVLYLAIADTGDPKDVQQSQQLRLWKISLWKRIKNKATNLIIFLIVSSAIGSIGLYILVLQVFFSAGSGTCDSPQCWGDYPPHFIWLTPLMLAPVVVYLPLTLIARYIHKARFSEILAPLTALGLLLAYISAAWLQLINQLASAMFPRRFFWAITLLALTLAAASARYISKSSKKLAMVASSFLIISLVFFIPKFPEFFAFSLKPHLKFPNTLPMGAASYLVPKYQTHPITDIVPSWLPMRNGNWRLDSVRPDFFIWWNTVSEMPSTRGYSNAPTLEHLDWIYYLQTATLLPEGEDTLPEEAKKNRALFLLDAFAVKLLQQPGGDISYDPLLLSDKALVQRTEKVRDWEYVLIHEDLISPIVSPTNAARVLVVSDEYGYSTLMRAISLVNLNSRIIIPIKGPDSINTVDDKLLNLADAVILYQFKGNRWDKIGDFVKNGGKVFIDIGSLENIPSPVPQILGAKSLQLHDREKEWRLTFKQSSLLTNVQTTKFSPLLFENNPWKIAAPQSEDLLSDWMQPVLIHKTIPILSEGTFGEGSVIFSGFNIPYHIVSYNNYEEAKLLGNIITSLIPSQSQRGAFDVTRPKPSKIIVSTKNSRGIYFKENYHPGWKATINGEATPIYKAGLSFMYLPLPKSMDNTQVEFEFRGSPASWGLTLLTVLSFVFALLYMTTSTPFRIFNTLISRKILRPIKRWWAKE